MLDLSLLTAIAGRSQMSFFSSLLIGIIGGIASIVLFVRCQNARSRRRSDLAVKIAAFARMNVEDSRKLLPPPYYPSWLVFFETQKLAWLNAHLTKIWPYIDQAASELIRAYVEPVLEEYTPVILSSLKFSKLTLGTIAPQFKLEGGYIFDASSKWNNARIIVKCPKHTGLLTQMQLMTTSTVSDQCRVVVDLRQEKPLLELQLELLLRKS